MARMMRAILFLGTVSERARARAGPDAAVAKAYLAECSCRTSAEVSAFRDLVA
jgi:hypothetical protein